MEHKVKKIPMRQCLGCNEHKPKSELMRVVRTPEGEILLDDIRWWSGLSVYDGPINPHDRIEMNNGIFYNANFKGKYLIDNIIIHYDNDEEEIISIDMLDNYEPFIFTSGDNLVICGKNHPYYHIEGCSKLEKNRKLLIGLRTTLSSILNPVPF